MAISQFPPGTPEALVRVVGFVGLASASIVFAVTVFVGKNIWEFIKFRQDRRRRSEDLALEVSKLEKARVRSIEAAKRGLVELERHHWENSLVMDEMIRGIEAGRGIPLEYQVEKFSLLPLPDFLADHALKELDSEQSLPLTKMQKMIPNFQREYGQAERAVQNRDLPTLLTMLKTLRVKADVGMRLATRFHQEAFGCDLVLHPDRSPEHTIKPVDYYRPVAGSEQSG